MTFRRPLLLGAAFSAAAFTAAFAAVAATTQGAVCEKDLWQCTEWGACSGESRTRVCTLANDCPNVETPKPPEQEACVIGAQGCTADTWSCEDWLRCDARGGQHRDCRMTVDCTGVQTVKPMTDRLCPTLQCDQGLLQDRIACRLKLEPAGLEREHAIQYMPELCRTIASLPEQNACVALYKSFDACEKEQEFGKRILCAKEAVGMNGDLKEKVVDCKEMEEPAKGACLVELRKKVHDLVLFRLFDLEKRAEGLGRAGAPFESVVAMAVAAEEGAYAFNVAATDDARVTAVKDVRAAWQAFLADAKPFLR